MDLIKSLAGVIINFWNHKVLHLLDFQEYTCKHQQATTLKTILKMWKNVRKKSKPEHALPSSDFDSHFKSGVRWLGWRYWCWDIDEGIDEDNEAEVHS